MLPHTFPAHTACTSAVEPLLSGYLPQPGILRARKTWQSAEVLHSLKDNTVPLLQCMLVSGNNLGPASPIEVKDMPYQLWLQCISELQTIIIMIM